MALTDNLISYWKLQGNSNDSSGSNNGTDTDITYGTAYGKISQGGLFNGSSSFVNIPYDATLSSPTSEITISVWVKVNTWTDYAKIVAKDYRGDGSWASPYTSYDIGLFTAASKFFAFNVATGAGSPFYSQSNLALTTGIWYHLVGTKDSTSGLKIYVNGGQKGTSLGATGNITHANTSVTIGQRSNVAPGDFFDGDIDEIAIWSRALTAAEVVTLYNGGDGLTYPFTTPTTGYVGGTKVSQVGSTSGELTFDLTALTGGIDTTARTGDMVIVNLGIGSTSDLTMSMTTAGYNKIADLYSNDTYDANQGVFWKVMGATPDTTVSTMYSGSTSDGIGATVMVFRGVSPDAPSIQTATGINGGQPTPPAITPTIPGSIVVCMGVSADTSSSVFTSNTLDNFISIAQAETNDVMLGMGSFRWSSGTYTPPQWTGGSNLTSGSWCAVTLALRPETGTSNNPTLLTLNVG